jgi:hypothetical protein
MNRLNIALTSAAAAAVIMAGVFGVVALQDSVPTKVIVHSLPAPKPSITSTPTAMPTPTPYTGPVALTVTATATMKWSNPIEPPDFVNVFQIIDPDHGYTNTCTPYLIAHSYARGYGAPGNAWEKLVVGNVVSYGGKFYEVDYTATPVKGTLAQQPVWGACSSTELVMITCSSRGPGNPATNNFVIQLEEI